MLNEYLAKQEDRKGGINIIFLFVVACKKEENKKGDKNFRKS